MTLRFGTDGVRGDAEHELTTDLVFRIGYAAARVLEGDRFVIGRDTRESGPRIERELAAGLAAGGVDVDRLGVAPTPAVAWVSATDEIPAAMISASHNVFSDNGIKLFAAGGRKLPDEVQTELEAEIESAPGPTDEELTADVGRAVGDRLDGYCDSLVAALEGRRLDSLTVVVDCANGAASGLAERVLRDLDARVECIHDEPDGRNINDHCGSTHPADLRSAVVSGQADVGLALDGDADRIIAVDEMGDLVDGDQIMAMCAIDLRDRGLLRNNAVAVTIMSNLGFRQGMAATAIDVVETKVGDRHVLQALEEHDLSLGGEQSGHVIFRDLATTGDGLLTGLLLLDVLGRTGRHLSDWVATSMVRLPQVLKAIPVGGAAEAVVERIAAEIRAEEEMMGGTGRVLVRPSGTEPVVRVMVEAASAAVANEVAARLAKAVQRVTDG